MLLMKMYVILLILVSKMQKLELFSGIGGFTKGFEEAGYKFDNVYFSEVDKHAIANYKYNNPNAKHIGSVIDFRQWKNKIGRINILSFGSPCQNFSLAGNRKGLKGRSSSLIQYAIMAIEWFRPDIFIWENVKGAYSSNKGEDFQAIFERLANIDGYRLETQLLNTSWVLPQNRERIYLIGHLTGRSEPGVFPFGENDKTFTKRKGNQSQAQVCTTVGTKMGNRADSTFVIPKKSGTLTAGGNSGGLHSDMTVIPVLTPNRKEKRQNGRRFKENGEAAFTLNCQDQHGIMITSATAKGYETATEGDSINFSVPNSKTRRGRVGKGKSQTLDTQCNQGVIIENPQIYSMGNSKPGRTCLGTRTPEVGTKEKSIRRLTENECERLQGFSDDWTKYGLFEERPTRRDLLFREKNPELWAYHTKQVNAEDVVLREISKTQRYKMLGNAVSVPVITEIAHRLKHCLKTS